MNSAIYKKKIILSCILLLMAACIMLMAIHKMRIEKTANLRRFKAIVRTTPVYNSLVFSEMSHPVICYLQALFNSSYNVEEYMISGSLPEYLDFVVLMAMLDRFGLQERIFVSVTVENIKYGDVPKECSECAAANSRLAMFRTYLSDNDDYRDLKLICIPLLREIDGELSRRQRTAISWDHILTGRMLNQQSYETLFFQIYEMGLQNRIEVEIELRP